jgi:glycosyltransferase involved in cell wall biosynthesis
MQKIRVGVDVRELTGRPAGKGLHLLHLLEEWKEGDFELIFYTKKNTQLPHTIALLAAEVHEVSGRGLLWHRSVAKRLTKDRVELFLAALSYQSAIWNKVPTITIVPDLIALVVTGIRQNRKAQLTEKLFLKRMLTKTAAVICCSHATKSDLEKVAGRLSVPVVVTHLAPEKHVAKKDLVSREKRQREVLFVGTLEPRKNIKRLLEAFQGMKPELQEEYRLVFAGKEGWGGEGYAQIAHQLGIAQRVDFLGYISTEEREKRYKEAYLLCYPSLYEGFGLPVIEAMSYGTPVITSNTSSIPEVVGSAAILVDPTSTHALTSALEEVLTSPTCWEKLHLEGFERAQEFSWAKTARKTKDLLLEVYNKKVATTK